MSAPQGIVSYPGLATFTKAEYVLSQGISPGKCTIELPQNLVTGLQPTGNLTFEYNDLGIALPNCLLDSAHIDQSEKGYIAPNLAVSYETRIESGPLRTRSFLLPETARCRFRPGREG